MIDLARSPTVERYDSIRCGRTDDNVVQFVMIITKSIEKENNNKKKKKKKSTSVHPSILPSNKTMSLGSLVFLFVLLLKASSSIGGGSSMMVDAATLIVNDQSGSGLTMTTWSYRQQATCCWLLVCIDILSSTCGACATFNTDYNPTVSGTTYTYVTKECRGFFEGLCAAKLYSGNFVSLQYQGTVGGFILVEDTNAGNEATATCTFDTTAQSLRCADSGGNQQVRLNWQEQTTNTYTVTITSVN